MSVKETSILFLILTSALLNATEVKSAKYGFFAKFPDIEGWAAPLYNESRPHTHSLSWTAKNETKKEMIYISIIDAPLPDKKPTFEENALALEKYILRQATKKLSSNFTTLGGVESYRIVGKTINSGSEYYFVQWMAQNGQVTYQISLISEQEPNLENGAFYDFVQSIEITYKKDT